ncbi:MAG: DUF2795 domain-containing protein, partial [Acidimicrobiales bacterium]
VFHAVEASAPPEVVDRLRTLPADTDFANLQDVWASLGGATEDHHS